MNLIINIKTIDSVELELVQNRKVVDRLTLRFKANLDTVLIGHIDKILERNKIDSTSLKTIEVKVGSGLESSSAYNIAMAVSMAIKSRN